MASITLTRGYTTEIDDADYEWLSSYSWQSFLPGSPNLVYAVRGNWNTKQKSTDKLYMHREIIGINDPSILVDHQDGNSLNNRRNNLRATNRAGNFRNAKLRPTNKSGYKGVSWSTRDKRWTVRINIDGKAKNLGYFDDIIEAAKVYDAAARIHYGEFARVNFPLPGEQGAR